MKTRQAILDGLTWLGLDWDGEPVSQHANAARHAQVANQLLADGHAYKCFATQDEIEAFRENARANKTSTLYLSPWRDVADAGHPDLPLVIRLKAPRDGSTTLHDEVQGDVTWSNDQLDDMILLRSDGSPVYMLAVVVDDHDMGVTHVVRGDDHLANAFRQNMIYEAMGWAKPSARAYSADFWAGWQKAVQTPRCNRCCRISDDGLSRRWDAQLFDPPWMEPR